MSDLQPIQPRDFKEAEVVVLDLGGVILDVDYRQTLSAFEDLGLPNAAEVYSQGGQQELFDLLERGEILPEHFFDELKRLFDRDIDADELRVAWNSMLGRIPESRMAAVERIAAKKPLYLLSNTNAIHKEAFYGIIASTVGINRFEKPFRDIYLSHEIGMRKPEREVFDFVTGKTGVPAHHILFIDDTERHVRGALAAGWSARFLDKGMDLSGLV